MWIWAFAYDQYLRDGGSLAALLDYEDAASTQKLRAIIAALDFSSVTGRVKFDANQDR